MISSTFALPEDSQRLALNDEVHARPPVRLAGAQHVVYLAVRHGPAEREAHRQALARLAQSSGAAVAPGVDHALVTLADGLRFKWEGHAEFATYTFFAEGGGDLAPAAILERSGWPDVAFSTLGQPIDHHCRRNYRLVEPQHNVPPRRWCNRCAYAIRNNRSFIVTINAVTENEGGRDVSARCFRHDRT